MQSQKSNKVAADQVAEMRERAKQYYAERVNTHGNNPSWTWETVAAFALSELRRLGASVDVEGLARTIIERVAKDAVMLAIVRSSLEWDKDLEQTDEEIAEDAVNVCTGDDMGCLDESNATPENSTHLFVAAEIRKHIAQPAAPIPQVLTDQVIDFNHEHDRGFVPEMLDED